MIFTEDNNRNFGGSIRMKCRRLTNYVEEKLECPKCGREHSFSKYKVINVTEKGDMKDEILKNRLFQFTCDSCNYTAPLTYDSLYVDSRKNLMVCLAPAMTPELEGELRELEQEKGVTKRLVDNINDLKEKIMIADNKLDDRIIELIKIMYLNQIKKEMEDDTLLNILFDYSRDSLCFLVFFQKKGIGKIPLTRQFYKEIEEKYKKTVEEHSKNKFMKIDMTWAGSILLRKR